MRALSEQHALLRKVDPDLPIVQWQGEPFMVVMQLPDGREVVNAVDGGYDVWSSDGSEPVAFNLTLGQVKELIPAAMPIDGQHRVRSFGSD